MFTLKGTLPVLAVVALCTVDMPAYALSAGNGNVAGMPKYTPRHASEMRAFDSRRDAVIRLANQDLEKVSASVASDENQTAMWAVQPVLSNGPVSSFLDLDGPDGELWYYSSQLYIKSVKHAFFTEKVLQAYRFDIYDSTFSHVGYIFDRMEYGDDEVRVPGPEAGISLLPVITRNYFNSDDNYEVVVGITVNSTTEGVNHTYSRAYSLDGDKVEKVIYDDEHPEGYTQMCDVMLCQMPSLVGDVIDASKDGVENYYLGFEGENSVSYYGKAGEDGALRHIHTFGVDNAYRIQGDFEYTPLLLSFVHDGKPYVVFPTYRENFFDFVDMDDDSGMQDMVMHQGNYLDINLYTLDEEKANLVQTTSVPVIKDTKDDVLASYYQVGGFRWSDDVSFDTFTHDGRASFYITRSNYLNTGDTTADYCFYVYDPDGNKIKTIFEYADRYFSLSDVKGCNPQYMFTSNTIEGYYYNMVDIVTGDKSTVYSYIDTGYDEPELISANMDRVDMGDGTYKYAFEMRVPLLDEDDNTLMRVAWLNADGSVDRIDNINLGKNIDYAQSYITSEAMQPDLFKEDAPNEYMAIVKYIVDGGNEEHLIVAQACTEEHPLGVEILRITPCEKGVLNSVSLLPVRGETMLSVRYLDNGKYNTDFYKLPLEKTEIGGIEGALSEYVHFDGSVVSAPDLSISVFDISGVKVAQSVGAYDTAGLSAGIYIVVTDKGAFKIMVK